MNLHHPIFEKFEFHIHDQTSRFHVDGLGIRTDKRFFDVSKWHQKELIISAEPPINDHYLEWISVLTAVWRSSSQFTMIELGAGYAPWLVAAAVALRQLGKKDFHLIAVEAEPQRYLWAQQHFKDNALDPKNHIFIEAAIVPEGYDDNAWFLVGDAANTYGAAIVPDKNFGYRSYKHGILITLSKLFARIANRQRPEAVATIKLSKILEDCNRVNLLSLDIQGSEESVLSSSMQIVDSKVEYIHIGTHSKEIEEKLRVLFQQYEWEKIFDFGTKTTQETPYGKIAFDDGVQAWQNPRFNIKNQ